MPRAQQGVRKIIHGSGRTSWQARWYDDEGRRRSRNFTAAKDANDWLDLVGSARRRGKYKELISANQRLTGTSPTVAEYVGKVEARRRRRTPTTIARDEIIRRRQIAESPIGDLALDRVTRDDIERWVDDLTATLSRDTIEKALQMVRRAFESAVDEDLIPRNPARNIELSKERGDQEQRFVTPEESVRLVEAIDGRYKALILVQYWCGLRWGEVAGLRVRSVDFEKRELLIDRSLDRTRALKETKTGERRRVAMPRLASEALARHLQLYAFVTCSGCELVGAEPGVAHIESGRRCGEFHYSPNQLVFTTAEGKALDYNRFRIHKLLPAITRSGVEHMTTRSLRHGHLATLVAVNVPTMVAKTRMGHRDIGTTFNTYGHQLTDADRAAADAIDEMFWRPNGDAMGIQEVQGS